MRRIPLNHTILIGILLFCASFLQAQESIKLQPANIQARYDSIYQLDLVPPGHQLRASRRTGAISQQSSIAKKPLQQKRSPTKAIKPGRSDNRISKPRQPVALPACVDSSYRKLFYSADRVNVTWAVTKTKDGGFLVGGSTRDNGEGPPWKYRGSLIKFDMDGNLLWATELRGNVSFEMYCLELYEMADGSIIWGGEFNNAVYDTVPNANYYDGVVVKLNPGGTIIWSKTFHSTEITCTNSSSIYIEGFAEGANGDILVTGTITNCPWPLIQWVMRLDANGNIRWSKSFHPAHEGEGIGVFYHNGEVLITGRNNCYCSGSDGIIYLTFSSLDYTTGQLKREKAHKVDQPAALPLDRSFVHWIESSRLANGHFVVYGQVFGVFNFSQDTTHHFSVVEFDENYNFVKGYVIKSNFITNRYTNFINVDEKGIANFVFYQNVGSELLFMMGVVSPQGQFLDQRKLVFDAAMWTYNSGRFVTAPDNAFIFTQPISKVDGYPFYLEYSKFHYGDTNSLCMGFDTVFAYIDPIKYVPYDFHNWTSIANNTIYETSHTMTQSSFGMVPEDLCPQTSFCDTIKLRPTDTICSINDPFIITAFKNRECGSWVNWTMDTSAIQSMRQLNDSTVMIRMRREWSGYLHGTLQGKCGPLEDSIRLVFINSPDKVELGPDTSICPANTLQLNARRGFLRYQWQDGSTDSIFTVTQPGTYHVAAFDACSNAYRDTIVIAGAPPIPFNVGADRIKCNNDTIQLKAPAGFMNYNWSPNYQISSTTNASVVINPQIDTTYTVRAEKTPGCFAYDTIRIQVNHSASIYLGRDTSFCNGDSVLLDAGAGFSQYQWSTGQSSQQISLSSAGTYSVVATDNNGCRSYDTLRIIQVFPLPIVSLNPDPTLCETETRLLDAGAGYSQYVWNNGSTQQIFPATGPGTYSVLVTDRNGCSGSDTSTITTMLPEPHSFLAADTSICSYGKLELKPNSTYDQYLWSNNAVSPSITVSDPGVYWLEVTDNNKCKGRDSIQLERKDCLTGFYVPNAFTPNKDGKNDVFRPLLFGNVKQFHFAIYNRWGQLIFETKELYQGWNGTLNSKEALAGQYVWRCTFQIDGEKLRNEQGTVVLIR